MSRLERTTNWMILGNICVMFALSLFMAISNYKFARNHSDHWYIFEDLKSVERLSTASFFSFWLILNSMIPLELPISMEISKFVATYFMQVDAQMTRFDRSTGTVERLHCNTLNLHEELGEIEYMFCDKTGTLTKNELKFKTLSFCDESISTKIINFTSAESFKSKMMTHASNSNLQHLFNCMNLCQGCAVVKDQTKDCGFVYNKPSEDEGCLLEMAFEVK